MRKSLYRLFLFLTIINTMLSWKEIIDQLLDYLELTPGAFANKIGLARPEWLSRLEQEYGYILLVVNNFQASQVHYIEKLCIFEVLAFNY